MNDAMTSPPDGAPDGHLRVSDRERDEAVDLLAQAATDGRLTLDEYSERTDKALASVTRADLTVLIYDLGPSAAREPNLAHLPPPVVDFPAERLYAVFGSETRRGRWPVPAKLDTRAIFGECKVELQDASLHARVTVIDASAFFGSVEIVVPDGVEVTMTGVSIFGSRTCQTRRGTAPGAPVVEVRGRAIFGEIKVRHPGWKEGVRKAITEHIDRRDP